MTALALGCASRKHLVGLFHAANPATDCSLERLHKWLQGRALPRSATVTEDLAAVLGSERDGTWMAGCTLEDFAAELERLFGRPAGELLAAPPFAGRGSATAAPAAAAVPQVSGNRYLCGRYACYSLAWSPYATGKLVRGALALEPGRGKAIDATYSETVFNRAIVLTGSALLAERTLNLHLLEPGGELPLFFNLFLPRPPAAVLCGVLSGVTFLGGDPEPSSCRIAAVRLPAEPALKTGVRSGYLDPDPRLLADDLTALGLPLREPGHAGGRLLEFLIADGRPNQVTAAQQAELAALLDPLHLAEPPACDEAAD